MMRTPLWEDPEGLDYEQSLPGDDFEDDAWPWNWVDGDLPEWEREFPVDEHIPLPDPPIASCILCQGELFTTEPCWSCWCERCRRREAEPSLDHGMWCVPCWAELLCAVCGAKPRVSGHRCDTCRKYWQRNGRERPRRLTAKHAKPLAGADRRFRARSAAIERHQEAQQRYDEWVEKFRHRYGLDQYGANRVLWRVQDRLDARRNRYDVDGLRHPSVALTRVS
jgi:hypothetical protein